MVPFQLIWFRYQKTNKHYLALYISQNGGKIITLDADAISKNEASIIRENIETLKAMNKDEIFAWLKNFTPNASKAIKYFDHSAVNVLNSYDIEKLS